MTAPRQEWWTAAEIADAGLPGLPLSRQGVERLVKSLGWRDHPKWAKRSAGTGRGWRYNWQLFPIMARKKLLAEAKAPVAKPAPVSRDDIWAAYDQLSDAAKAKAQHKLTVLQQAYQFHATGLTLKLAVTEAARLHQVGASTVWTWISQIEGIAQADWLAYLAPKHKNSGRKSTKAGIDPAFYDDFKTHFLRFEAPTFQECFRVVEKVAKGCGWAVPNPRTLRRKLNADIARPLQVLAREGLEAFERCFAPQIRDRSHFSALEGTNADCHKIDVFVEWDGCPDPVRPQLIVFQDLYSNKILSWRVDLSPNSYAVLSAFGDMVDTYGIPKMCFLDNGMEFAAKSVTGGTKFRRRFKVREDEPKGVMTLLGVNTRWVNIRSGKSKPIEREFKNWANDIAKDIRFAGAYVGNNPMAKPENYRSRAVPLADFLRVVEEKVNEANARPGRQGAGCNGRSYDETFNESYANSVVTKATPEQRRLWLMAWQPGTIQKTHGWLRLYGNYYHNPWMAEHPSRKVVARFDPEKLHSEIYLYSLDGEFLGEAECQQPVGFDDLASAKFHEKRLAKRRREAKKRLKEARPVPLKDAIKRLEDQPKPAPAPLPETKVVEISEAIRKGPKPPKPAPPNPAVVHRLDLEKKRFHASETAHEPDQTAKEELAQFRWALGVEADLENGKTVGTAERKEYGKYIQSQEFKRLQALYNTFGETMFAG